LLNEGTEVRYQALRKIASYFKVLAWVTGTFGIASTVLLGIRTVSLTASVVFWLAGFVATSVNVLILLAISQFIYLFLDMQKDLSKLAKLTEKVSGD